ncbi:MAG: S9 family peptidase [Bacteroidia bacterium]|nr:S9 family peptidase [Bacteroidia bacterium]
MKVFIWLCVWLSIQPVLAKDITDILIYSSSISQYQQEPLYLRAELNWNDTVQFAPMVVIMHGFSPATGNFESMRPYAQWFRSKGMVAISVSMRGRDGSQGKRDSGGLEIYDIYDAIEATKKKLIGKVNPNKILIVGFSGGGGNVFSAVTRFPDYFRAAAAFFPMTDYGWDTTNAWFFKGASENHQKQLIQDIGDPRSLDPNVRLKYLARSAVRAAINPKQTEFHAFVNVQETICPKENLIAYEQVMKTVLKTELPFHIHYGGVGIYEDLNRNGKKEKDEHITFPHDGFTIRNLEIAGLWFLDRFLNDKIKQPVILQSDSLWISGFLKTKAFEVWVGDGQEAASAITYQLQEDKLEFRLHTPIRHSIPMRMLIPTNQLKGKKWSVLINGYRKQIVATGEMISLSDLKDKDEIIIQKWD